MKIYDVKIYFSGYTTKKVTAEDGNEAIARARKQVFDSIGTVFSVGPYPPEIEEIVETLEHWRDADTAEEVE